MADKPKGRWHNRIMRKCTHSMHGTIGKPAKKEPHPIEIGEEEKNF